MDTISHLTETRLIINTILSSDTKLRRTVPHQYECRGSSAGITGGEVGDTVTGAPVIVGDAVIVGDIVVGAKLDGESDGMCVNPIVGLNVISVQQQSSFK